MAHRDPDFDPLHGPRPGRAPYNPTPEDDLRIIANPFLSVLLGFAVFKSLPRLTDAVGAWILPVLILTGLGMLWSLQYHCLDFCATGRLLTWKRHVCPSVQHRRALGLVRRFRGPRPALQVCLWFYALLGLLVMAHFQGWF